MSKNTVHIAHTGTANIASVKAAFSRFDCDVVFPEDPQQLFEADFVVLPGVGTFGASKARLVETGAWPALEKRLNDNRPTLAICVGLHLLCNGSEESPGETGFGVYDGRVVRFDSALNRVPQMGWNHVSPWDDRLPSADLGSGGYAAVNATDIEGSAALVGNFHDSATAISLLPDAWLSCGYAYFANSFAIRQRSDSSWKVALSDYGGEFIAAMRRGPIWGLQCHPELSSDWGARVIQEWIRDPHAS